MEELKHDLGDLSLRIEPGETVRVGTTVSIKVAGEFSTYVPVLELLHNPEEYPAEPKEFSPWTGSNNEKVFRILTPQEGIYAFRLKRSRDVEGGRLIQIHAISADVENQLASIIDRFKNRFKSLLQPF